jgi:hypothetical protein
MVAAIRNVDFRQITSVALAVDRHDLAKLGLLLGPAASSDRAEGTVSDAFAPDALSREQDRRRFL